MKKVTITFEIWDTSVNEPLVNNLSFEDMAEQLAIYQEFFGAAVVAPFYRESPTAPRKHISHKDDFVHDWLAMIDELCDNIY